MRRIFYSAAAVDGKRGLPSSSQGACSGGRKEVRRPSIQKRSFSASLPLLYIGEEAHNVIGR